MAHRPPRSRRPLGATVRQHGTSYDEAYAFAVELAQRHGYRFLSAFDDADVIAGQGTVGIELAAHAPDVVIVPIGGGGLASGVALALKSQGVRVIGAQVEGVDSMARAIRGDVREIARLPSGRRRAGEDSRLPDPPPVHLAAGRCGDRARGRTARNAGPACAGGTHHRRGRGRVGAGGRRVAAAASVRWCPAATSMPVSWPACSPTSVRPPRKPRRRRSETPRSPTKASALASPPLPLPLQAVAPAVEEISCDHHRTNYHPAHPHLRHHPA